MSDECPHCHSDLTKGKGSRVVGVEIQGVYDGVLFWQCPDCGGKWHRWPEGHPYRERAEKYLT